MRKTIGIAAVAIVAVLGITAPASASHGTGVHETSIKSLSVQYNNGQVCLNAKAVVNGEVVVDEVHCQPVAAPTP